MNQLKNLGGVFQILAFFILVSSSSPVYAHGDLKKVSSNSGDYIAEISYDQTDLEISGSTRISFYIKDKISEKEPQFEQVYVAITKDKQLLFAGPIDNSGDLLPSFTYQFPNYGNYQISTNFQNGGESIAETSFTLEVPQAEPLAEQKPGSGTSQTTLVAVTLLIGIALGFLPSLIYVFGKKKSKD